MKVKVLSITRVIVSVSLLVLLLWGKSVDGLKVKRLGASSALSSKSSSKEKLVETLVTQTPPAEESCSKTSCPGGIPPKTPGYKSSLHSSDSKPIKPDEKDESDKSSKPVGGNDIHSFEAISFLHRQLDDDANGNIDVSESDEFLRDELQYENGYERQKTFHGNDKHISVDELWKAWKMSEVHNWTSEQTIQWLVQNVELPQYAQVFQEHNVNGATLPRMAVPNMQYLTQVLGIKDHRHKQKLALKAMDVVLFGPPRHHNYVKDSLLVLLLVIAIGGCWFAYVQHKHSQAHMKKMMRDMESLQHAEEALEVLAKELDKAREENLQRKIKEREAGNLLRSGRESSRVREATTNGGIAGTLSGGSSPDEEISKRLELEEELRRAKEQLARMEQDFENRSWSPPQALQHWLQLTYELEQKHYNSKKANAEQQLAAAKEGCEKIRKRRSSFLGTFRIAHGGVIDDVDNRILQARSALSEVTKDLQERLQRWRQIELLCGFPIVMNPGLLQLEAILRGSANGSTATLGHISARSNMSRSCSEGTLLDEETVAAAIAQAPVQPYSGTSAGSVITMPGYVNAHLPPGVVSELRREHVLSPTGRLGSSNSLSSESKSQPAPAVSASQLHQLDEEVATDDEVDNGELDDHEEVKAAVHPIATTNGGRAASAPPEDRATFILGGDSPQAISTTAVRGRIMKAYSQDQPLFNPTAPHHSPFYQQQSSSSSSSLPNTTRPPSCPETSHIPSNQLIHTDSTESRDTPTRGPAGGQISPSGSVSSSGGGSVSGRRKKTNLMSALKHGLPSNPPPTLEEENSTDSASVDESDNRKEKKKTSLFSRLKKKK